LFLFLHERTERRGEERRGEGEGADQRRGRDEEEDDGQCFLVLVGLLESKQSLFLQGTKGKREGRERLRRGTERMIDD
jgi:hypothetical protein